MASPKRTIFRITELLEEIIVIVEKPPNNPSRYPKEREYGYLLTRLDIQYIHVGIGGGGGGY